MIRFIILPFLFLFLFLSCELPFTPKETDDEDLFVLSHDYNGRRIVHESPITIFWSEVTIEDFKEYLIERAVVDDQGVHWGPIDRVTDSLAVSYIDTIDDDVTYQYRVRIVNKSNQFRHTLSEFITIPEVTSIYVPDDYASLQEPYNSLFLDPGDSLYVDAGLYPGNFRFLDKEIVIQSISTGSSPVLEGVEVGLPVVRINVGKINGFRIINGISYIGGGGIHAYGNAIIKKCTIQQNTAKRNPNPWITSAAKGGGVYVYDSAVILDCQIADNVALGAGGGIRAEGRSSVLGCRIYKNRASESSSGLSIVGESIAVRNSRITKNSAIIGTGGGIGVGMGEASIYNCIVDGNYAGTGGGGISLSSAAQVNLINCVIFRNESGLPDGKGGDFSSEGLLKFLNSIVWDNSGELDKKYYLLNASYSNIQGLHTNLTNGNIDTAPKFVDPTLGDFHLVTNSPCIDAGHPGSEYTDRDGSRNDMGAYGGPFGK